MTVPSALNKMPIYAGNGVTTSFNYTFVITDVTDVKVYKTGIDGTTALLTTGYLVSPNDINNLSSGGHVIYPYPSGTLLATGEKLTVVREVDLQQDTNWSNGGSYNAETFEDALDKVVMAVQQHDEKLKRTLTANITESAGDYTLPAAVANKVIGWDSSGTKLDNFDNPGVAQIAAVTSAAAALVSEGNAAASAGAALASQVAAAASAAAAAILIAAGLTPINGWTPLPALTYVSATTATAVGDVTGNNQKGDKIWLTQTTAKYFYLENITYNAGTGLTTFTITGGSDYTLANEAITLPYYSKILNPQGFPDIFNYVPVLDGFSADPANACYQFRIVGQVVTVFVSQPNAGTSDANNFTITAPIAAKTITNMEWYVYAWGIDNNTYSNVMARILSAGTVFIMVIVGGSTTWTASGNKRASFQISYPI